MNNEYFYDVTTTPKPVEVVNIKDVSSGFLLLILIIALFWLVWSIAGLLAFFMSLVCFAYTSSMSDKFLGLIVALAIGPFYWLYYIYNSNYCTKNI
jgi:hypothetical protein